MFKGIRKFAKSTGPGIITGAADDDPSGIATYSQTGAQFGYGQLWTALFTLPFLISIQEACARIGAVQGKGIAAVIKEHYKKWVLYTVVSLVLIANTINIGANLGAMGAATKLIIPIPLPILLLFFSFLILFLEIFISYKSYAKILKWFTITLLAYPITVLLIQIPWSKVLYATFVPNFELSFGFLFIITGVVGTTISPYMFFWQASEEVEEERMKHLIVHGKPKITQRFLKAIKKDTVVGMFSSNVATWCIIVVAGTVLFAEGITDIRTAADAARALEPLVQTFPNAGFIAKLIFSIGILGLGFLSIPILSASASYAISEAFGWKEGLNHKFKQAQGFYSVIIVATVVGLMINFIGINPMKALVFTAVFNGVAAIPLIFIIARTAQNKKIMGEYASSTLSKIFVWATFILMATAAILMFYTLAR